MQVVEGKDEILGIERDLLEKFLKLLRDKSRLADQANYFLEQDAGISGCTIAIANQRDAFSHFISFLSSPKEREEQISLAEEHLRRAIVESYQHGVSNEINKLKVIYEEYKKSVIPLILEKNPTLIIAPNIEAVDNKIRYIKECSKKGRETKSRNIWDKDWEEGVQNYVTAFKECVDLGEKLAGYNIHAKTIKDSKRQGWINTISLIVGIVGIMFAGYSLLSKTQPSEAIEKSYIETSKKLNEENEQLRNRVKELESQKKK